MTNGIHELSPEKLRRRCNPGELGFDTTETLPGLQEVVGQQRALQSISFGIGIKSKGYHMFALGPHGTGKRTTIKKFLQHDAKSRPTPNDWLYVNNFDDQDSPRALSLPAGKGRAFKDDMDQLVEELKNDVPQAFEALEYHQEYEQIEEEFQQHSKELFQELDRKVREHGFVLLQTPQGLMLTPVVDGSILTPDLIDTLDETQRDHIERERARLQSETREAMHTVQRLQKEGRERTRELDRRVVGFAVDHLIDDLRKKYAAHEQVVAFLSQARAFLLKNVQAFKQIRQMENMPQQAALALFQEQPSFDEYRVNLLVDNSDTEGAPVAMETNPTGPNLIGRIEHIGQFGALVTNFRLIKGGVLHRCNGGYLIVDLMDVLAKPLAWQVLKRALKDEQIVIESMMEAYGALSTRTLQPQPIPLDIKVILTGDPFLYYLLQRLDPDFRELFKVKTDFDTVMEWNSENVGKYAQFIGNICREENLKHFDAGGVARVIEYSARLVAHQNKLATKFGDVVDLIRQASYWAHTNGNTYANAADVQKAIDQQIYRANRIEDRIREMIEEGTILIDTAGTVIGQVNGLSVVPLGDYSFGKPSRVTARTHVGSEGLVNIDREAKLSGPIHNKGALILAGYLGGKYADEVPLALSGSITFEQLYEDVEGDSASSTELYALLSSLSGLAIRQELAVTGSVNQLGEVQAIGGVNEKIEGFFQVCKLKGLSGTQGVLIPRANVMHLMLHDEVIAAVEQGRFHIYPIESIDEGIALLTGVAAGQRRTDGSYPPDTVNGAVQRKIDELANKAKTFMHRKRHKYEER